MLFIVSWSIHLSDNIQQDLYTDEAYIPAKHGHTYFDIELASGSDCRVKKKLLR